MMANWFTSTGQDVDFGQVVEILTEHVRKNGTVYVGTDSFLDSKKCTFSTAIVLHGAEDQRGGKYFIKRCRVKNAGYRNLSTRILEEVTRSVITANRVIEACPSADVELHIDVSAPEKQAGTSKLADAMVGYATSAGFTTKIKPFAFAAASVADKHSK